MWQAKKIFHKRPARWRRSFGATPMASDGGALKSRNCAVSILPTIPMRLHARHAGANFRFGHETSQTNRLLVKLSNIKNLVVELGRRFGVFQRFTVLHVPFETLKHARRLGIDAGAPRHAMKSAHHLLAFSRQRKIDEEARDVLLRRLPRDHDRID